jgi:hypothetical protein
VTTAIPFVSGPEGQKNSFPFYFLVFFGIVFTFVMLRDGPVDAPREAAIQGFGVKSNVSPAIGIQQAIQTYVKEENQVSYEQSIQIIRNLTVDESVLILRHVVSETRAVLPGSDILALLILDQGGKRDAIFQKLESDELAILGEVIETAGVVDVESVEDAMAALDLFKGTDNEFSSGISLPSFESTVSNQADVNQTVLEDIRATDPDLAELIERNRQGSTSQEVQSS